MGEAGICLPRLEMLSIEAKLRSRWRMVSRESGVGSRESGVVSQESGVGSQESGVGSSESEVEKKYFLV